MSKTEFEYHKKNIEKDWETFCKLKDQLTLTQKAEFAQALISREIKLGI
ncbi:MAG: Unknown protein [uncultured Sulfurovum sp.]|uniref:Uncharacterized protein n=1 Tax=uncultured Sulfurovum sp. TaxID=269237 RepID=A0A6S6SP72_9BACT|nr:MAG: Unknown protein [uncultured Sulfurovum sp.]